MKKKYIALIVIGGIVSYLSIFAFIFCFIYFSTCAPTTDKRRRELYEYYSDDSVYQTRTGKIEIGCRNNSSIYWVSFLPTESYGNSYDLLESNSKILKDSGFLELCEITEQDDKYTVYYYSSPVTVIVCSSGGEHTSYNPTAVGLSVDDTVYLDFETGKANLLNYIQYELY